MGQYINSNNPKFCFYVTTTLLFGFCLFVLLPLLPLCVVVSVQCVDIFVYFTSDPSHNTSISPLRPKESWKSIGVYLPGHQSSPLQFRHIHHSLFHSDLREIQSLQLTLKCMFMDCGRGTCWTCKPHRKIKDLTGIWTRNCLAVR